MLCVWLVCMGPSAAALIAVDEASILAALQQAADRVDTRACLSFGRSNKAPPCLLLLTFPLQVEEDIPSPDAKPTYHDVVVSVVQVQDSQTMYYLANPENGKKVVRGMLDIRYAVLQRTWCMTC